MRENAVLIEQSFADAIAMIAAAEELPEEKRRHWATDVVAPSRQGSGPAAGGYSRPL
jgi:hypothetical protein